jgi:hypothetical protein
MKYQRFRNVKTLLKPSGAHGKQNENVTFSHPDYTVGPGI